MKYEIVLSPEAVEDLKKLKAHTRAAVRDALDVHLRHEPTRTTKSRIKRLRGLRRPQFRLRAGDEVRVSYDVSEDAFRVEILAIVSKSDAREWLEKAGESDEGSRPL
jgi:mRNA-degrading endonuclease RelE of RelBE toxin-antitoxin system